MFIIILINSVSEKAITFKCYFDNYYVSIFRLFQDCSSVNVEMSLKTDLMPLKVNYSNGCGKGIYILARYIYGETDNYKCRGII